jgi:DNA-binding MarR family transcriptional regulator
LKPLKILSPLHKAMRQIDLHLEASVKAMGVSNPEGHLITYLARYAPCPISELHRVFGFKRSTLTSMLDRLEARALIRRQAHTGDRRSLLIALRPKGKALAKEVRKRLLTLENKILAQMKTNHVAGFQAAMEAVDRVTAVTVRQGE